MSVASVSIRRKVSVEQQTKQFDQKDQKALDNPFVSNYINHSESEKGKTYV